MLKLEKSKEQPFADLLSLQRNVKKELAAQTRFIKAFQLLAQEEEDLLSMINLFDCPVAVFERGGILHKANRSLMEQTDLQTEDIIARKINFLGRITNENFAMLEATDGVFYGKTALLSRLTAPLGLFCKHWSCSVSKDYHSTLFFPLPDREGQIPFGVVMLLKGCD